jgi:allantoate deiminase
MDAARKIMERIRALGQVSEENHQLTRTFASPAMRRANELVGGWMRGAGMSVREDAIGNLIGHYPAAVPEAKVLLLGSHLDTVRNAGTFDGPLGVILAIACVEELHRKQTRLPFAIEVIGFADEEGTRFQTTYLGSRAAVGVFNPADLKRVDANGISIADALRNIGGDPARLDTAKLDAKKLLGYVEVHIEQGPVLEKKNLAVGVVTAIAGQSRLKVTFSGRAGHAGTTPMVLRKDAMCAAAEYILAVEKYAKKTPGLVATVGQLENKPNASNVIPDEVNLSLDVRHQKDVARKAALKHFRAASRKISSQRSIGIRWQLVQETASVPCAKNFSALLNQSAGKFQREVIELPSGAGHDAAIMAKITPAAMLFVRCKAGISHHPAESARAADVNVAFAVTSDFISSLARQTGL